TVSINNGSAPFTGNYRPQQQLSNFNDGQNPNGTWWICFLDEAPQDWGQFQNATLYFDSVPPPPPPPLVCNTTNSSGCVCPDGTSECDLLPDMTNSGYLISIQNQETPGQIRISTGTPNIGYGPLEVHGTGTCFCDTVQTPCNVPCPPGISRKELVTQTIYHKNGSVMTSYNRPAGTMTFHPTHGHMHVDDWVRNTIRLRGPNPNPLTWPIVAQGNKISFCLINLGNCTNDLGYCVDTSGNVLTMADIPNSPLGSVSGCGRNQGIYVGNLDVYSMNLDGQQIPLPSGMCNGQYYLVSVTDPNNNMLEENENNNWSATLLTFTQQTPGCCQTHFRADTLEGLVPFTVAFIDSTVPIPNSWLWDFGDGNTSTDQFPVHTYTTPGVYTVTLTTNNTLNCSSVATRTNYIIVNQTVQNEIAQIESPFTAKIQPNPFHDVTKITLRIERTSDVTAEIYDVYGKLITQLANSRIPQGTYDYQFSGNASGIYFLKVRVNGKSYHYKLLEAK
ncbi:MAG: PKD domain-containing protein, partial [Bacteroidia bacterium]|nr:PKD domain-containing protein [Bacteroidia bacterium]